MEIKEQLHSYCTVEKIIMDYISMENVSASVKHTAAESNSIWFSFIFYKYASICLFICIYIFFACPPIIIWTRSHLYPHLH